MAAALAECYSEHVSVAGDPRLVAALALFLSITSRPAREQLAPSAVAFLSTTPASVVKTPASKTWTKEELSSLETNIARLARDHRGELVSLRKKVTVLKGADGVSSAVVAWIHAAASRLRPPAAAPSVVVEQSEAANEERGGTRRERSE
jgi:hypothetical protein